MAAFSLMYALHFALGIFVAVRIWPYPLAILALLSDLDITTQDFLTATSITGLSILWYFVWYGSLKFSLSGEFPLVTIRIFSMLIASTYLGAGVVASVCPEDALSQLVATRLMQVSAILLMVSLAIITALNLPKLKHDSELEKKRLKRLNDERLDQLHRISNSRSRF
jgi:hypothetical protein